MNKNNQSLLPAFNNLIHLLLKNKFRFILLLLTGLISLHVKQIKSEEIFLKCIGKYEINRGPLIKPEWETSYLMINQHSLISKIFEKVIKKDGTKLNKRNSYIITHFANRKKT